MSLIERHEHLWYRLVGHMQSSGAPMTWTREGGCDPFYCRWHIKGWTAPAELAVYRRIREGREG